MVKNTEVFFLVVNSNFFLLRSHLVDCGLADECVRVARMASLEEIRSVHSEQHTLTYGTDMLSNAGSTSGAKLSVLGCGGLGVDSDTYWNDRFTGVAARTAVGSVVELATKVSDPRKSQNFCDIIYELPRKQPKLFERSMAKKCTCQLQLKYNFWSSL